jgi:hypothetical protein
MKSLSVTWDNGYNVKITVHEWDGCGPIPSVLSDYGVISVGDQNHIREDLSIIRKMTEGSSLSSYDFSLTYRADHKEFKLWVRNWSGGNSSRASWYAGMIHAVRKMRKSRRNRLAA